MDNIKNNYYAVKFTKAAYELNNKKVALEKQLEIHKVIEDVLPSNMHLVIVANHNYYYVLGKAISGNANFIRKVKTKLVEHLWNKVKFKKEPFDNGYTYSTDIPITSEEDSESIMISFNNMLPDTCDLVTSEEALTKAEINKIEKDIEYSKALLKKGKKTKTRIVCDKQGDSHEQHTSAEGQDEDDVPF